MFVVTGSPDEGPASLRGGTSTLVSADRTHYTLAGWIRLIAEDRGLDAEALAGASGLPVEDSRRLLDGRSALIGTAGLGQALLRLEGRVPTR